MNFTPPGINPNAGMSDQEQQMVKMMQASMESCVGKTVMAGVMGGGLGAMFGLFMSSQLRLQHLQRPPPHPQLLQTRPPPLPLQTHARPSSSIATHPTLAGQTVSTPAGNIPLTDLPLRQQLKHGLRDMYRSSISSGKNFAKVGAIFSGTECAIEGLRAKNDLWNGVAGGCITGGVLARGAGPQAAAVGCAGFAAFSAAIDAYMRMPEDERSRPIA
ncbi:Mitochondrial import inner membrane translocase subunit tim22 [Kalmusia sp. IMI 367209]|nr:Mitochondrial import inner membrane translocase subunit tim22 [Kalmusia sp. IMI 367209]